MVRLTSEQRDRNEEIAGTHVILLAIASAAFGFSLWQEWEWASWTSGSLLGLLLLLSTNVIWPSPTALQSSLDKYPLEKDNDTKSS